MKNKPIGPVLEQILVLTLVGCAGCGGEGGGNGGEGGQGGTTITTSSLTMDTAGFEPATCAQSGRDRLTGLALEPPADYLELGRGAKQHPDYQKLQSVGTPCATATDPEACQSALDALESQGGFFLGHCLPECIGYVLVTTSGDDVAALGPKEAVLAAMGTIDSPADAMLAVELAGYNIGCGELLRGGVKTVEGGFEVLATRYTEVCQPVVETRYRLAVSPAGEITELDSDIASRSEGECI